MSVVPQDCRRIRRAAACAPCAPGTLATLGHSLALCKRVSGFDSRCCYKVCVKACRLVQWCTLDSLDSLDSTSRPQIYRLIFNRRRSRISRWTLGLLFALYPYSCSICFSRLFQQIWSITRCWDCFSGPCTCRCVSVHSTASRLVCGTRLGRHEKL